MATVYLAHDERHDRSVTLKVLEPELAAVVGADRFLAGIHRIARFSKNSLDVSAPFSPRPASGLLARAPEVRHTPNRTSTCASSCPRRAATSVARSATSRGRSVSSASVCSRPSSFRGTTSRMAQCPQARSCGTSSARDAPLDGGRLQASGPRGCSEAAIEDTSADLRRRDFVIHPQTTRVGASSSSGIRSRREVRLRLPPGLPYLQPSSFGLSSV